MMTNEHFKLIIDDTYRCYITQFHSNEEVDTNEEKDTQVKQAILLSLFNKRVFHITHKCICQQVELGTIDNDLLVELRKFSVDLFSVTC